MSPSLPCCRHFPRHNRPPFPVILVTLLLLTAARRTPVTDAFTAPSSPSAGRRLPVPSDLHAPRLNEARRISAFRRCSTDGDDTEPPAASDDGGERARRRMRRRRALHNKGIRSSLRDRPRDGETSGAHLFAPDGGESTGKFNVVLTHCYADFDTLASAVGLAKLWSSKRELRRLDRRQSNTDGFEEEERGEREVRGEGETAGERQDFEQGVIPTYVVLPRGAHPAVQRYLSMHKHLFPIRGLKSLPAGTPKGLESRLHRLGLVDAQRRDRVGPAEHLLSYANHVTVVDHHIDKESDIPEATDYVVEPVGSVSTMVVERLRAARVQLTEAEATLLALGIHSDTGSLCFGSTTARDASALAYVMRRGASQAAIAEHAPRRLSKEQQEVLTQALIGVNSTVVHGVTVSTVLLHTEGFVDGLAAVTQDALELSSTDIMLLGAVYDAKARSRKPKRKKQKLQVSELPSLIMDTVASSPLKDNETSALWDQEFFWKGGNEALRRKRLQAAFNRRDYDGSGFLEQKEIAAAVSSAGVIASESSMEKVMQQVDKDGDGRIDFEEFYDFVTKTEEIQLKDDEKTGKTASTMILIGRAKAGMNLEAVNLNDLFEQFGGGGHPQASSCTVRLEDKSEAITVLQNVVDELINTSIMEQKRVKNFMTSPTMAAEIDMTADVVEDLFVRYDLRALPVVDKEQNVVGLVTYKEVGAAKQRQFNKEQKRLKRLAANGGKQAKENEEIQKERPSNGGPVKGWMLHHVTVVEEGATITEVEGILMENDIGSIPVVGDGTMRLKGMVTRTDLLRQHRYYPSLYYHNKAFADSIESRKHIRELRKKLKAFDLDE